MSEKRFQLVSGLLRAARNGKLRWQPMIDRDTFLSAFPDSSVTIAELRPGHPSNGKYEFTIADAEGRTIDSFTDRDFAEDLTALKSLTVMEQMRAKAEAPTMLRDLYLEARRSALEPEKVVDSLLDRLKQLA